MITTLQNKLIEFVQIPDITTDRTFIVNFYTGDNQREYFNKIILSNGNITFDNTTNTNTAPVYENGVWVDDVYRTLLLIDGADISNVDLITFVEKNADIISGYNIDFKEATNTEFTPFASSINLEYSTDREDTFNRIYQDTNLTLINNITIKNNSPYLITVSTNNSQVLYTLETGQETNVIVINENTTFYIGAFNNLTLTINSDDTDIIINNDFRYDINGGITSRFTELPITFNKVRFVKIYNFTNNYRLYFRFNNNLESLVPGETRTLTLTNNTDLMLETEYVTPKPTGNTIVGGYRFNDVITPPTQELTDMSFELKYHIDNQPYLFHSIKLFKESVNNVKLTYVNRNVGSISAFEGTEESVLRVIKQEYRYLIFNSTVIDDYTLQWLNANGSFGDYNIPIISDDDIILYQNTAEINRVDKTDYLTEIGAIGGVIRKTTNVVNLEVDIEYNKFPDFNYVYFKPLNRYYFVESVDILNNRLFRLYLLVDVLMSYRLGIISNNAFVDRNEFTFNPDITDDKRVIEMGQDISVEELEVPLFNTDQCCIVNGLLIKGNERS